MSYSQYNGFSYLVQGVQFLKRPGIRKYAILPILINTCLFIAFFFFLNHQIDVLNEMLREHIPGWLAWLTGLVWILFFSSYLLIILYTFTLLTSLIIAPFSGLLAEEVEQIKLGNASANASIWALAKDIPRVILRELSKILYYLPRIVIVLLCYIVPFLQLLAPFIAGIFSAWMMAIQVIDYPMDNHKVDFKVMIRTMKMKKVLCLSFGCGVLLLAAIPVINFIVIPASVAGATLLWIDHFKQGTVIEHE